jgi:hypothetical protein
MSRATHTAQPSAKLFTITPCLCSALIVVSTLCCTKASEPPEIDTAADTATDTGGVTDSGAVADTTTPPQDTSQPPQCTPADAVTACKDFNPCTEDNCVGGKCENPPIAGCCTSPAQCDDGVACTEDKCMGSKCTHAFEDNLCCLTAKDCNDGEPCTENVCAANHCVFPWTPAADCKCIANFQCDDKNPCTQGTCKLGACVYESLSGDLCCTADADCDDKSAATFDACQQGICWNKAVACLGDDDCVSPNPCDSGTCANGKCTFTQTASNCCVTHSDCDDAISGTVDRCVNASCVHDLGDPQTCASDADCTPPNGCVQTACNKTAGLCSMSPATAPTSVVTCCSSSNDCEGSTTCVQNTCEAFQCVAKAAGEYKEVAAWNFDDGTLGGWTVVGDGKPAKWQITDNQAISKPNSMYFGQLPQKNYDVGTTAGTVTSPVIEPLAGATQVRLRFNRNVDTELGPAKDKCWLTLLTGGNETVIWEKNDNNGPGLNWKSEDIDITQQAKGPFQLKFHFDSMDGKLNRGKYQGVYVDNVIVDVPCP